MDSVPLLLTMIAVAWLVIWSLRDFSKPSKRWWPFDMRGMEAKPEDDDAAASPGGLPAHRRIASPTAQVGAAQVGAAQVGTAQVGTAQVGTARMGAAKAGQNIKASQNAKTGRPNPERPWRRSGF